MIHVVNLIKNTKFLWCESLMSGIFIIKSIIIIEQSYMSKNSDVCNTSSLAKIIFQTHNTTNTKGDQKCKNNLVSEKPCRKNRAKCPSHPPHSTTNTKLSDKTNKQGKLGYRVENKCGKVTHPSQEHGTHTISSKPNAVLPTPDRCNNNECSSIKWDKAERIKTLGNFYQQKHLVNDSYGHNENHLMLLLDLLIKDGAIDPTTIRRSKQLGYDDAEINKVLLFVNELKLSNNLHLACLRTNNLHQNTLIPNPLSKLIAKLMVEHHKLSLKTMDERLLSVQPEIVCKLVTRSCDHDQDYLLKETLANDASLSNKKDLLLKVLELSNYIHNNLDMSEYVSTLCKIESKKLPINSLETICSLSNRIHDEPLSVASIGLLVSHLLKNKITHTVEYPYNQ